MGRVRFGIYFCDELKRSGVNSQPIDIFDLGKEFVSTEGDKFVIVPATERKSLRVLSDLRESGWGQLRSQLLHQVLATTD